MDYEVGNTIRIWAEVRDWDVGATQGDLVEPESIVVNTYKADKTPLNKDLVPINTELGIYRYDWTLPNVPGSYFIEVIAHVNGKPQLTRQKIKTKWDVKEDA